MMTAEQFAAGNFVVSAITDIAYQYTKNLIGQADKTWLQTRLNDVAKNFFVSDLNGDGAIDSKDLLMFVPTDDNHKSKLNFDYQQLFDWNDEHNYSIMKCYHYDMRDTLLTMLDYKFGSRLSLNPAPDTRYQKVKIEVAAFGKGSVKSDVGGIDIDSARTNAADNVKYAFFDPSATGKVVLTATPKTDTQIMSWNGCDTVSQDKTKCESNIMAARLITVSFGYKEAKLRDGVVLVNLTNAAVTISSDLVTLNVTANSGDTDMAAKLAALKAGDFVVGSAGSGFLRKVVSVQNVSNSGYILTTSDASIVDVVAQGSGGFFRQMTHGDLAPDAYTRSLRDGSQDKAVRLLPSDDPNDKVFRLVIGNPGNTKENIEGSLEIKTPEGVVLGELKGTADISIDVEHDQSVNWDDREHWYSPPKVEYFNFIAKITATESVELTLELGVETPDEEDKKPEDRKWEKELKTISFAPISFVIPTVPPVPVLITPQVKIIIGLEGKISGGITGGIKFIQRTKVGILYHNNDGVESLDLIKESDPPSSEVIQPKITGISGELKPYFKVTPAMLFYSLTGPAIPIKGYLKVAASADANILFDNTCHDTDGISAAFYAGLEIGLAWDMGHIKKILGDPDILKNSLEFKLWDREWLLYRKNFGGTGYCTAPFMEVRGEDINSSVTLNSGQKFSSIYTVKNTGKTDMEWEITYPYRNGEITVLPSYGKLVEGQSVPVTVTVDTGKINKIDTYKNSLKFENKYDFGLFSDQPNGSTERMVTITVTRPPLTAPVMSAQLATTSTGSVIPTIAELTWSYPDSATLDYVKGYVIYMTQTLIGTWQKVATVNSDTNTYQVPNLQPNIAYYFKAAAFSDVIGNMSEPVSVTTSSNAVTLAAPVMGTPMATSSSVSLSWTYPDSATANLVLGYNVYMTTTPNDTASWQQFAATGLSYQAVSLQPDTTYYFAVAAYGKDSGGQTLNSQRSQQAQIKTLTGGGTGGDITNSLNMSFKLIQGNTFMMGSPTSDTNAYSAEKPQHQVTLSSFYMQTTEVTQGQWKAVMGNTIAPYFTACGDTCPMENISWNDIQTFLTALNSRGDGTYRLPTEAEWEYAARGGTSTWFAFGNCLSSDQANYDGRYPLTGCTSGQYRAKTVPVMSFAPNAFGLYDMHGNVWEWVQDWYSSSYYTTSAVTNPTGPSTGSGRVLRGGSWNSIAQGCRSAYRYYGSPGYRSYSFGFRLVRSQ